ncbi:MAG TPA: PAS domain S-box protein [Candidatus Nanopelagicaceae bacterium]|nr:PAS domain S-box protein [Candidatus Nanopelagicaceae bacterium]
MRNKAEKIQTPSMESILESIDFALMSMNFDGIITSWNYAAERMYGYSTAEMLGQDFSRLISPEHLDSFHNLLQRIRDGHNVTPYEAMHIRKIGDLVPISISLSPIREGQYKIAGVAAVVRELTWQLTEEQAIGNFLEAAHDAMLVVDNEGRIVNLNSKTEEVFGYSRMEMLQQPVEFLMPARFRAKQAGGRSPFLFESEAWSMDVRPVLYGLGKDGMEFAFEVSSNQFKTQSGEFLSSAIRVLTEQDRVHSQDAMMATLVEQSDDAIMGTELDGTITIWNPAAERIFGYLAKEVVGKSLSILVPSEMKRDMSFILGKIRNNERVAQYETVRVRKDGTKFPVSLSVSPIHNTSGDVIGTTGVIRDITEQVKTLDYIRKMASVVESSNDGIISTNLDGVITSWNPAAERIYGYSAEETLGRTGSFLIPPDRLSELATFLESASQNLPFDQYETLRLRKDGRAITVSMTISPIRDSSESVTGMTLIIRDITTQKELAEHLDDVRNDFVAMAVHDIRSPTTSISGFAQLLMDQWERLSDEGKFQHLQVIARNTERLVELVENVLQVAQFQSGKFTFNNNVFDVQELTTRSIFQETSPGGVRQISLISPDALPLVFGDLERQAEVLANLISNARKFSPDDQPIVVSLSVSVGSIQVSVADRGIGIRAEDRERLFQRFSRIASADGRKVRGTGLGLYICRTIVEAQGGKIWYSDTPGGGSTFSFTIPLARTTAP